MQCFGDLIAMEGTNANEPCRIGSIRPRRQARERRSLQPSKSQVPSGKSKEHIGLKASSSDQLTFWPDESLSARREPQCPTKASVPDESKLELVQLAPRTAPRTTPRIRKLI